jgi:hypothetical protein
MRRFSVLRHAFLFLFTCLPLVLLVAGTASAAPKHPKAAATAEDAPPTQDPPATAAPASEAKPAAGDTDDAMPASHAPVTMKVGILVNDVSKFDLAAGTFNTEFLAKFTCEEEPCKPDLDVANGKLLGKPEKLHDEPLVKVFKVKAELGAIVDLSQYPFDDHELQIMLVDKGDPEQIRYVVDNESMGLKDSIKLPGWDVTGWSARASEDDLGDGQKVAQIHYFIGARRPALMATFKSVVPVLIMLFVAAFTLLLKPKSAAGRLGAATGGLMSIVMFQVGQVGSLPPLGYLTRFDKFMIATYLIYLANIAFSVAMVRFEEKKNERMSELMYLAAAGAVPGLALLTWTTVFLKIV